MHIRGAKMPTSDAAYIELLSFVAIVFYLIPIAVRPAFILVTSYAYYLTFPWTYFPVLIGITIIAYVGGLLIERLRGSRYLPILVAMLLVACFTPMVCYKLVVPWVSGGLRSSADWGLPLDRLPIPVGISFYTFAAVGYLADVALGLAIAERQAIKLGLFCGVFPCVTQGPVARTGPLFLQFDFASGCSLARVEQAFREILIGLILKRIFTIAFYEPSQLVYSNLASSSPLEHLVATIYFAFQVYADWMGYALIAVGSARLIGIDLPQMFHQPYLAASTVEFWRSWNVSLVDWLRDYVFMPLNLAARKVPGIGQSIAILITFVMLGLWHAAGWGFVVYGVANGILVASSQLTGAARDRFVGRLGIPTAIVHWWRVGITFLSHVLVMVLVRADGLNQALSIYWGLIGQLFRFDAMGSPDSGIGVDGFHYISFDYRVLLIAIVIAGDLLARYKPFSFERVPWPARVLLYAAGVVILAPVMMTETSKPFLYFQF